MRIPASTWVTPEKSVKSSRGAPTTRSSRGNVPRVFVFVSWFRLFAA